MPFVLLSFLEAAQHLYLKYWSEFCHMALSCKEAEKCSVLCEALYLKTGCFSRVEDGKNGC